MNIEEFREYCLLFKGVYDRMPFKKQRLNMTEIYSSFM